MDWWRLETGEETKDRALLSPSIARSDGVGKVEEEALETVVRE